MIFLDTVVEFLLDTNIIIYLINQDSYYLNYFTFKLADKILGISIITYIETLIGVNQSRFDEISNFLTLHFSVINLGVMNSYESASDLSEKRLKGFRNLKYADTIIANTARDLNIPLVTNNSKDFKKYKDLKIIVP